MSCPACDKTLRPKRWPDRKKRTRAVRWGDWWLFVYKNGQRIMDAYAVHVPNKAWRYREPIAACSCNYGFEAYLDMSGNFSVRKS